MTFSFGSVAIAIVVTLKILLIPAYTSTDFEVHRNWLAITFNLNLSNWYYESTSQWTLDYPPFFAYFEMAIANVANALSLDDILVIQESPLISWRVLVFQRLSVIVFDVFYMVACYALCFQSSSTFCGLPRQVEPRARLACFLLLISNAGLVIVDNIHFQYNSMLTTFLVFVIFFVEKNSYLMAAACFCVLINFKHIYLYYGPAMVFYYIRHYFGIFTMSQNALTLLKKGIMLASAMLIPFAASLWPFLSSGGIPAIQQIIARLFPVSRGLTHAYWAPNIWALYNVVDLALFRVFSILKIGKCSSPTYSSGLVQEHSHSVLPNITPTVSLLCILLSLVPLVMLIIQKTRREFSLYLVISAFSFFFFGYHVHEKALLLISIPLIHVASVNVRFGPVCLLFNTITSFSLFPLLFTSFETPLKYAIALAYVLLNIGAYRHAFGLPVSIIVPVKSVMFIIGLVVVEVYNTFVHSMLLGGRLPFVPLMLISIYNAIGVAVCYIWIVKLALEDDFMLIYKKKKCELTEMLIKQSSYAVQSIDELSDVQIVGGVDISTSKKNSQFAVVSLAIYKFPSLEHLASYEQNVLITEPYMTDYLAVRESAPIAEVIRSFVSNHPQWRPDVLICDGNGQFHSRGCGVASHIGALCGIATIGVAKNLNLSLLKKLGADDNILRKVDKLVKSIESKTGDGCTPFDAILPVTMNIVRLGGSKTPVFVSAGYGIDLDLATELVQMSARNRICEPVRMADLRSREKVRQLFDE